MAGKGKEDSQYRAAVVVCLEENPWPMFCSVSSHRRDGESLAMPPMTLQSLTLTTSRIERAQPPNLEISKSPLNRLHISPQNTEYTPTPSGLFARTALPLLFSGASFAGPHHHSLPINSDKQRWPPSLQSIYRVPATTLSPSHPANPLPRARLQNTMTLKNLI